MMRASVRRSSVITLASMRGVAAVLFAAAMTLPAVSAASDLEIVSPPLSPAFGEVDFTVRATDDLKGVAFYVDDVLIGQLDQAPWTLRVDVGQNNSERRFRVVAETASGETLEASMTTPAIRVDEEVTFELQQLYVTVTRDEKRVLGLPADAFRVFDNDQRQEIVTFEGGEVPLVAALLLDGSASMKGEPLAAAIRGVESFVGSLAAMDLASVSFFGETLTEQTPWANWADRGAELTEQLSRVEAAGNTALWDVLYRALAELEERQGRRVVVLLSDGSDVNSVLDMDDVYWKAQRSASMIYWLRLEESSDASYTTAWRDSETNTQHRRLLERAVRESGGRIITLRDISEVSAAFAELISELREQYVLGYYPSARRRDGGWREVSVQVRGTGLSVRSRSGYVDR